MYILVPSFPSIYFALHHFYLNKDVTVITNNTSVKRILEELKINCIYLNFEINFKNVYKSKNYLGNIIEKLDLNKELYLLDNIHFLDGFYLSKQWTKGKVFYKNLSTEFSIYDGQISTKYKVIKIVYKLFLGLDLIYRSQNGKPVFGINDNFLLKFKIKNLEENLDYNKIKLEVLQKVKIDTKIYESILVLQGTLAGIVKPESLALVYKEIIKLKSIVIKDHPKHSSENILKDCDKIPNYYPVEICYGNISNNIISVYSLSLILASKLNDKKAISLLEIVEWYNEDYKNYMKEMLIKESNGRIFFPNSIMDLNKLLKIEGTL